MRMAFRITAILALLVTIAAAGAVLYGVNTLVPAVESAIVTVMPAAQEQQVFDDIMEKLEEDMFSGKRFSQEKDFSAENCAFVTMTIRLTSRGFFPAEWVTMSMTPLSGDIAQLPDSKGYMLAAGSTGDISCTVLTTQTEPQQRSASIDCYILGREFTFDVTAQ